MRWREGIFPEFFLSLLDLIWVDSCLLLGFKFGQNSINAPHIDDHLGANDGVGLRDLVVVIKIANIGQLLGSILILSSFSFFRADERFIKVLFHELS
jgi:hypothetical protein